MRLLAALLCLLPSVLADCTINLQRALKDNDNPPLLLQNNAFLYPTEKNEKKENILTIDEGSDVRLYCHSLNPSAVGKSAQYLKFPKKVKLESSYDATLTCMGGDFYLRGTQSKVGVESVGCSQRQEPQIISESAPCSPVGADGRKTDLGSLVKASIGWNITGHFIQQISLCIDEKVFSTIWTAHTIHGKNIMFNDVDGRVPFRVDNTKKMRFFQGLKTNKRTVSTTTVNKLYTKSYAKGEFWRLLGTNSTNGESILDSGTRSTIYLARGHLAPDNDFQYNVQQHATYFFINVAPQFQSFNGGNWVTLENNAREYAVKAEKNITVYTGTHDILEYPNKSGKMTPMFLNGASYVPVPKYYWKVLQDPNDMSAVVFIGLNDPHAKNPKPLCPNRCGELSWVDWDISDVPKGYMYCCDVEAARKAIPAIPQFEAGGLLGKDTDSVSPVGDSNTCSAGPCTCTCLPASSTYTCTCNC